MLFSPKIVRIAITNHGLLLERNGHYKMARKSVDWLHLSSQPNMHALAMRAFDDGSPVSEQEVHRLLRECQDHLINMHHQAVLAFGVTFKKSEVARDDEYKSGGDASASGKIVTVDTGVRAADTPYTRVGPRGNPAELFGKAKKAKHLFKPGQQAGIRSIEPLPAIIEGVEKIMNPWNVHEPEIATIVTPCGHPVAFGLALDMSDRRDEGISALLLTKAKIFWHCAGFGHWFTIPENPLEFWNTIVLQSWAERNGEKIWPIVGEPDTMSATQCRRPLTELCLDVLDSEFVDDGESAVFMSGTGIVPAVGDTFSLLPGDAIKFQSEQLGEFNCGTALVPRPRRNLVELIKAKAAT